MSFHIFICHGHGGRTEREWIEYGEYCIIKKRLMWKRLSRAILHTVVYDQCRSQTIFSLGGKFSVKLVLPPTHYYKLLQLPNTLINWGREGECPFTPPGYATDYDTCTVHRNFYFIFYLYPLLTLMNKNSNGRLKIY